MWFYQGKEVNDIQDLGSDIFGFVYQITNTLNGKIYIGKKALFTDRKKRLTKRELAEIEPKKGKKPIFKREVQESNWKAYYGSSKLLLEDLKLHGKLVFRREILKLCKNKKQLTYWQVHYQCINNVLLNDSYNESILGKFFHKDLSD